MREVGARGGDANTRRRLAVVVDDQRAAASVELFLSARRLGVRAELALVVGFELVGHRASERADANVRDFSLALDFVAPVSRKRDEVARHADVLSARSIRGERGGDVRANDRLGVGHGVIFHPRQLVQLHADSPHGVHHRVERDDG